MNKIMTRLNLFDIGSLKRIEVNLKSGLKLNCHPFKNNYENRVDEYLLVFFE